MANFYYAPTQNAFSTTLNGAIDDAVTTITLNSVTTLQNKRGVLVIERQNSAGTDTPATREYISFTGISGNDLTGVTRGVAGSTAQSHSDGALVEAILDVTQWGDLVDIIDNEHTEAGTHILSAPTLTGTADISSFQTRVHANNLSGASATGEGHRLFPAWYISGNVSAATTSLGRPLAMPVTGTWDSFSVTLRAPISAASLLVDINKNFTSIFEAGTRLSILGGGTYASTASINTQNFVAGDVFTVDVDAGGEYSDMTIVGKTD